MKVMQFFLSVIVLAAISTLGFGTDKNLTGESLAVDPSGTWRWDFEMNGNAIKNVLKLEATADGKVTGTLSARDMKMEVLEGQIKDGKLSFNIKADTPRSFKIVFDGKIDGDKVEGTAEAKSDDGSRDFPWTAKRSVEPSDVVGAWKLKITLPNDQTLQPMLTFAMKDDKLTATFTSDDGKVVEVKQLEIKENQLQFEMDTVYEGADLHVEYKGRPYGARLKGKIKYTLNNDSGELEYTGAMQPDKSK